MTERDTYYARKFRENNLWVAKVAGPGIINAATDALTEEELAEAVPDLIVLYTDRDKRMPYEQAIEDFDIIWSQWSESMS